MVSEKLLIKSDKAIDFVNVYPFVSPTFLLAVGIGNEVHVYECTDIEKDGSTGETNCIDVIVGLPSPVKKLSWSPQTSLISAPQLIRFFIADSKNFIRRVSSNLKNSWKGTVVGEHGGYVNSIAIHPEKGNVVATTADDNSCCVWTVEDKPEKAVDFKLSSPGMSVSWHAKEPSKLMVAEKCGVIRFYSLETRQAFMSLDCNHVPLLQAHWSPSNPLEVAAIAGSDLFIFNTSQSSQACLRKKVHPGGGTFVMWCPSNGRLLVTAGEPRFQVNSFDTKTLQVSACLDSKQIGSLDIHPTMPVLYVGIGDEVKCHQLSC